MQPRGRARVPCHGDESVYLVGLRRVVMAIAGRSEVAFIQRHLPHGIDSVARPPQLGSVTRLLGRAGAQFGHSRGSPRYSDHPEVPVPLSAPGVSRTPDLQVRSLPLYPVELRARGTKSRTYTDHPPESRGRARVFVCVGGQNARPHAPASAGTPTKPPAAPASARCVAARGMSKRSCWPQVRAAVRDPLSQ